VSVKFDPPQRIRAERCRLADTHVARLRFLEVGDDPHVMRHEEEQLRARRDIRAVAHADFRKLAVDGRVNDGVFEIDLREAQLRFSRRNGGFEARAADEDGAHILRADGATRFGLTNRGLAARQDREGLVSLACRDRAVCHERVGAAHVSLCAFELRFRGGDRGVLAQRRRFAR
jgi:hypothetical protein